MAQPVLVVEKGTIKPAKRRELENSGYIVLIVDNVDKVKILGTPPTQPPEDDGFNLDGTP